MSSGSILHTTGLRLRPLGGRRAPMRRRNRARILEAARTCFAESGLEAQVDEIARRAGVGVGTVYRHFPTKEALYEALAADHFLRLAATAREALGGADPWESFSGSCAARRSCRPPIARWPR